MLFSGNASASTSRNITIFTEPNMVLVMTKIARLYSKQYNVIVSINFSPSSDSIDSIDLGEPADIFISAHHQWIDTLRQKGLVDVYNKGFIARDELVLATSKSNKNIPAEILDPNVSFDESMKILDNNKSTIIFDYEGNSSGKFSDDYIKESGLNNIKIFKKLAEDRSPVLSILRGDSNQYALLLASQVKNEKDFQILSTQSNKNIFYQAMVIAGDHMKVAREFLKFLKSNSAKEILNKHGFIAE